MSSWHIPAHDLLHHQAVQLAELLRTIDPDDPALRERVYSTTLAGDERKLRGIPAIGRGVSGCRPGLRPGDDASKAAACATTIG